MFEELQDESLKDKLTGLIEIIRGYNKAIIAFSGGADSTLLSFLASRILADKALAVTINSEFLTKSELSEAIELAKANNINHKIINTSVLTNSQIASNDHLRCKYCKEAIIAHLRKTAQEYSIENILDGTNTDDTKDYRPGFEAARVLGIKTPFLQAGFNKADIRKLSAALGLHNWNKPASACLASRIPYGTIITEKILKKVEEAEFCIRELGYNGFRVRHHGNIARIELNADDIEKFISQNKEKIVLKFENLGYNYVCLDLKGYRTGSLNEIMLKDMENDGYGS